MFKINTEFVWEFKQGFVKVAGYIIYYEFLSSVLQEPVLFATSVLENIRYGRPDATDEEVREQPWAAFIASFLWDCVPRGWCYM